MSIVVYENNLGHVTAYAYAKSKGYQGTEEEFAIELARCGGGALVAEGFAVGEQDGVPVTSESPYYHNNSKYYAEQAGQSATDAETAKGLAEDAKDLAQGYAQDAYNDAERAEQAATTAGYMEMQIDENGHLIYTRTDQVGVDFDINNNGHLIMESVA